MMTTPLIPSLQDVRRAIAIAQRERLRVVGKTEAHGVHVYAVPSRSRPGQVHLPYIDPELSRVVCDCPGFRYRGVCAHAMTATREVIAEAETLAAALTPQPNILAEAD